MEYSQHFLREWDSCMDSCAPKSRPRTPEDMHARIGGRQNKPCKTTIIMVTFPLNVVKIRNARLLYSLDSTSKKSKNVSNSITCLPSTSTSRNTRIIRATSAFPLIPSLRTKATSGSLVCGAVRLILCYVCVICILAIKSAI